MLSVRAGLELRGPEGPWEGPWRAGSEGPGTGCVPGGLTYLWALPPQAGEVLSLEQQRAYGRNLSREGLILKQVASA